MIGKFRGGVLLIIFIGIFFSEYMNIILLNRFLFLLCGAVIATILSAEEENLLNWCRTKGVDIDGYNEQKNIREARESTSSTDKLRNKQR